MKSPDVPVEHRPDMRNFKLHFLDVLHVDAITGPRFEIILGAFHMRDAHRYYYGVSYYGDRAERCAGVFYGGNPAGSFKAAWVCVAVIIAWTGSTMTVLFGAMKATRRREN